MELYGDDNRVGLSGLVVTALRIYLETKQSQSRPSNGVVHSMSTVIVSVTLGDAAASESDVLLRRTSGLSDLKNWPKK